MLWIVWKRDGGGGRAAAVKGRKRLVFTWLPVGQRLVMCELTMLSRMSKFWRWVHSLVSSQPSIVFSFVHLIWFAIFLFLHTSFCPCWKRHLWSFNFLFPDDFYLVFLDFCLVGFPFHNPCSYSSEATWQLIVVCSAIYIYTSYFWITYMYVYLISFPIL